MLHPVSGIQQRYRLRRQGQLFLAELLTQYPRGTVARLPGTVNGVCTQLFRQSSTQPLQLGGLAAAVQSLKYNEFALFHTPTSFCFSPQYSKISTPGQDQGGNWGDNLKIPLQYRAKIGMI